MAITDYKVSETYSGRDIASLSDRPNQDGLNAAQLKARFDQLGKEVIPNYNDLIDFIEANLFSGGSTNTHTHNVDNLEDGTVNRNYTQTDKTKLNGIATGAEVNQNAFSNVKVGSTTIPSTNKTDTIELVAGLNITMTVDVATKKVFLSATGDLATEAVQSLILDIGNYYEALNVEDALQELGAVINGLLRSEAYFGFDSNQQMVTLNFQDGTSLNLGSELWYAQGKAVGSIANGDNVMLAGSQGDHYLVKKAVASELAANPQLYLGVATKGSANNEWVKITRWGLVNDVNTNGWTYGTKLYFDPVTLGFTSTLPSLPNARIEVGIVVKQHSTVGIILVLPFALNLYTNAEIDAMFNPSTSKTTPIDADSVLLVDSGDSNILKKLSWLNIKTTLKSYFDTLYQTILVSGTSIKTINSTDVLGSGDIVVQATLVNQTNIKSVNGNSLLGSGNLALEEFIVVALSDETTALTTGTGKLTFRMPYACKFTKIPRINLNTVSSSGLVTVDIKKNGTTIFSTLLTIDVSEKTSVTATTPCVLSSNPTTFADDDEITFDITVAGTGAKGLKATLFVEKV